MNQNLWSQNKFAYSCIRKIILLMQLDWVTVAADSEFHIIVNIGSTVS